MGRGGVQRPARAAIGVVVGGGLAVLGCLVQWAEGGPLGMTDGPGIRTMLILALVLVGLGLAMIGPTLRRGWWWIACAIAALCAVGAAFVWLATFLDLLGFSVGPTSFEPSTERGFLGLPLYIAGCAIAAISARRIRPRIGAVDPS